MALDRTTDTDDDGSGTTGTVHNNAWLQALYDAVDTYRATRVDSALTSGTTNDYNPGIATKSAIIRLNPSGALTITGLVAGTNGQLVTFVNLSSNVVTFAHNSGSSSAANRFANFATSAGTPIAITGYAIFWYDGTSSLWRMLSHEQGAWITPTYAGGNFSANGSMTWTVDSADVGTTIGYIKYRLSGRTMHFNFMAQQTSVGGTVSTQLWVGNANYGGFSNVTNLVMPGAIVNDNAAGITLGFAQFVNASDTKLLVNKATGANWTLSTNNTAVYVSVQFEVN